MSSREAVAIVLLMSSFGLFLARLFQPLGIIDAALGFLFIVVLFFFISRIDVMPPDA